ncbi:MAG: HypC/HybG/HupF family hydrogenase formation chaperone [Candidatus Neomarinimicrobiota bacterium]
MCLAIPMRVIKIQDNVAEADVGGVIYRANLDLLPDINIGDYIIVHAGFAIEKLDVVAALETLEIWNEMSETVAEREAVRREGKR